MKTNNKLSAGILVYKLTENSFSVLLVHPGGPYWAKKDLGIWSVPKGELEPGEGVFEAARREFYEETGFRLSWDIANYVELTPQKQKSGKTVFCFATEGDFDAAEMQSNSFQMEWPPKSGKMQSFPEVDKAGWFPAESALNKILEGQKGFIGELAERLGIKIKNNSEDAQLNLFSF